MSHAYIFKAPSQGSKYAYSGDDDILRYISLAYAFDHPELLEEDFCGANSYFEFGITNGADWYPVIGVYMNKYILVFCYVEMC